MMYLAALSIPVLWIVAGVLFARSKWDVVIRGWTIVWVVGILIALCFAMYIVITQGNAEQYQECMTVFDNAARCTYDIKWSK